MSNLSPGKENQAEITAVSLWNPNVTVIWSAIFSPIFGAWLQAKNWIALGDIRKARESMYWVFAGIVILTFNALLLYNNKLVFLIPFVYFYAWFLSSATKQREYVKENLNNSYKKKSWVKPFGILFAGLISYLVALSVAVTYFDSDFQRETALTEISGVWRTNEDGTMITLKLDGNIKTIGINEKEFPVAVKSFDNDNKILTLVVNNNPKLIWSVRQIFSESGGFTLTLTLQDGTQEDLSFIRNL